MSNGEIPPGLCVLHKCDNRKCINPDHLLLGTAADNTRDMFMKLRAPGVKLRPSLAREILARKSARSSDLAREYGVSRSTIQRLRSGKSRMVIASAMAGAPGPAD